MEALKMERTISGIKAQSEEWKETDFKKMSRAFVTSVTI